MSSDKTILFISRKFPPVVGGMENYAKNLNQQFKSKHHVVDVVLGKSQWHLTWFFPWIFFKGVYVILTRKVDLVYVGDGVLSFVAWFFQSVMRKKVVITIHGLDVIYAKGVYQLMIKLFLPRVKRIVANSNATQAEAVKRGVMPNCIRVIPVGVEWDAKQNDNKTAGAVCFDNNEFRVNGRKVLFTIGRLVERKGFAWFVRHVMPELKQDFVYVIAGGGPEYETLRAIIAELGLSSSVILVGKVSDQDKRQFFKFSDVFVSPNLSVPGNMEGFGIVNLEAGTYGLPVVAAAVDGVKDAVTDGLTGYLVAEKNAAAFQEGIKKALDLDKSMIEHHVKKNYSWSNILSQYESYVFTV